MSYAASHPPRWKPAWTVAAPLIALAIFTPAFAAQGMSWADAAAIATFLVTSGMILIAAAWRSTLTRDLPGPTLRLVVIHATSAVAFGLLWTLAFAGLVHTFLPERAAAVAFREGLAWLAVWGFAIYAALAQLARAQLRLRERERATARAELVAIRSQLDPHFLFNTLHSLTQLAREDPPATEVALERFGELMRYVLSAGKDVMSEATLEDEIAFARDYLALEELRFGERLRVSLDIEPDALELGVPPLLLQPLVENAVRHGIARRPQGGTVRLNAGIRDGRLRVEIGDDGAGGEPTGWRRSSGLGLRAVAQQLRARYGDTARLDVETAPGKGFAVRVSIPAHVSGTRSC